jgi:hypothetical protein
MPVPETGYRRCKQCPIAFLLRTCEELANSTLTGYFAFGLCSEPWFDGDARIRKDSTIAAAFRSLFFEGVAKRPSWVHWATVEVSAFFRGTVLAPIRCLESAQTLSGVYVDL